MNRPPPAFFRGLRDAGFDRLANDEMCSFVEQAQNTIDQQSRWVHCADLFERKG